MGRQVSGGIPAESAIQSRSSAGVSLVLIWLATWAAAQPCPQVRDQVEQAWAAFNDAELERSKEIIDEANGNLNCQTELVPTEDLLALYRLDALVSLSQEDQKGAVGATIRAVAADHVDGEPPDDKYGPALADLYRSWVDRLSGTLVTVRVDGGGFVWVDGRRADALNPIEVVEGEHLIQVEIPHLIRSELTDLSADYVVYTGIPGPELPIPIPKPVTEVPPPVVPAPPSARRKRPLGLLVAGGVGAALGGAALLTGYRSESSFNGSNYDAPSYNGCGKGQSCYAQARVDTINGDALKIRIAYGAGYGLTGVGVGLLGMGAIGLPARTSGIAVGWRW